MSNIDYRNWQNLVKLQSENQPYAAPAASGGAAAMGGLASAGAAGTTAITPTFESSVVGSGVGAGAAGSTTGSLVGAGAITPALNSGAYGGIAGTAGTGTLGTAGTAAGAGMINPTLDSSHPPSQSVINHRQKMALAMMEQGQQPLEANNVVDGYVVPVSPLSGVAKVAQQMAGAYMAKKAGVTKSQLIYHGLKK